MWIKSARGAGSAQKDEDNQIDRQSILSPVAYQYFLRRCKRCHFTAFQNDYWFSDRNGISITLF